MTKIRNKYRYLAGFLPNVFSADEAKHFLGAEYKAPIKVLDSMVSCGELIRLKRGLFAFASEFEPLAAAGRIHSPSYLSFETALGIYEMIPERVTAIMSVVDHRQLQLEAGGRLYIYRSQERKIFAEGMTATTIGGSNVLIATPEKALLDTIAWQGLKSRHLSQAEVYDYILNSYRLSEDSLVKLSRKHIRSLAAQYRSRAPSMFVDEWSKRKEQRSFK